MYRTPEVGVPDVESTYVGELNVYWPIICLIFNNMAKKCKFDKIVYPCREKHENYN